MFGFISLCYILLRLIHYKLLRRQDKNKIKKDIVKREKINQDLRVDMPTIGPETIRQVYDAKLSSIIITPGKVIVLEQDECIRLCKELSLSFIVKEREK